MKPSAKPISSPGRADKFPPPLMRFLRSNVGSKSRGRSRSSPMFMRKKNTASAIETQEPSSPKVTCMGQVRVRRSSKQARRRSGVPTSRRRRCRWIRAVLFCRCFPRKSKLSSCSTGWHSWVSFFRVGFRRKSKIRTDPPIIQTKSGGEIEKLERENQVQEEEEDNEDDEEEEEKVFMSFDPSSPPKNAFLLTRCRSAPYRSTSLASRFWGSPLRSEEIQEEQSPKPDNEVKVIEIEKSTSQRVSVSDQETVKSSEFGEEEKEEEEFLKKVEDCIRDRIIKSANVEQSKTGEEGEEEEEEEEEGLGFSSRPLILTRCKSEPARTAEKLNPELNIWKMGRLGIPETCLPNNS